MTTASLDHAEQGRGSRPLRAIVVTINSQKVELEERQWTGLEIKQAAIAQGVTIQSNFVLSVKHGNRYEVVGDADEIRVQPNQEFLAVAPDDNS